MQKIKKLAYLFIVTLVLTSCGEYHKVLNKGTTEQQYKMAVKLYEANEYSRALRLFEKIIPSYRGKPQMERIQYMVANSNFNDKNYRMAGYHFKRFTENYPKSSKKEDAAFQSALAYKLASPRFSLDQAETDKALVAFQKFINDYPNSSRIEEANKHYKDIRYKLQKKKFEIAMTYYRTADYDPYRNYRAAITAFDNLLSDYLGSEFKEEALYYRFKAYHDYVLKSTERRKAERIKEAEKSYQKLKRSFPESKFLEDADKMLATLQKEKAQLKPIAKI